MKSEKCKNIRLAHLKLSARFSTKGGWLAAIDLAIEKSIGQYSLHLFERCSRMPRILLPPYQMTNSNSPRQVSLTSVQYFTIPLTKVQVLPNRVINTDLVHWSYDQGLSTP